MLHHVKLQPERINTVEIKPKTVHRVKLRCFPPIWLPLSFYQTHWFKQFFGDSQTIIFCRILSRTRWTKHSPSQSKWVIHETRRIVRLYKFLWNHLQIFKWNFSPGASGPCVFIVNPFPFHCLIVTSDNPHTLGQPSNTISLQGNRIYNI